MENKKITITENERVAVQNHTQALTREVAAKGREGYYTYAVSQGLTEEEAHTLLDANVFPVVDEYNASCKAAMEDCGQLISQKIAQRIESEGMDEKEALTFKLEVLEVICAINARVLGVAPEQILTETERSLLRSNKMTEEMAQKIDAALVAAIENNALPLLQTQAFVQLLEGDPACGDIADINAKLWEDHEAKYCAAAALCIAYVNEELPSIPDGVSPKLLSAVACQGVDVAEIQAKVSRGELTLDFAYKILKIIAGVLLAILVAWGIVEGYLALLALGTDVVLAIFGTGAFAFVVFCLVAWGLADSAVEVTEYMMRGIAWLGKVSDVAYDKLKAGAKSLAAYVSGKIPEINTILAQVVQTVREVAQQVVRVVRTRASVTAQA